MNYNEQLQALKDQFLPYASTLALLAPALEAAVSVYVLEFQQHGGITDTDIVRVQSYLEDLKVHGNDLFHRSEKRGETAERFDQVAEIIAVLSFVPDGVTVFGLHFNAHTFPAQRQQTSNEEFQCEDEG
jgi:hypothetical protein